MGARKHALDHFWRVRLVPNGSRPCGGRLSTTRDWRRLRSRGTFAPPSAGARCGLSYSFRSGPNVLDGSTFRPEIAGKTTSALAEGIAGRLVAQPGHALQMALRSNRFSGASIHVVV